MPDRREPGEHRDPGSHRALQGPRPEVGPIAVLPEAPERFAEAVRAGGGELAELDDRTRGVIWLAEKDPAGVQDVLARHPGVQWVQLPWAGVDAFAEVLAEHADRDLPVWTSAKGAYAEPVAEHALALTLAVLRGLPEKTRAGSWAPTREGISLYGRRVVIVGAGGVALELIRLLAPFETDITVVRRGPGDVPGARRTVTADRLHDVLADADVVVLAAAATSGTRHLIGEAELAAMPAHAALVNIARGSLVDQEALDAALQRGHLSGAGLDVTTPEPLPDDHPLWSAPRCVITSHTADTPEMVEPLLALRVRANVQAFVDGGDFVGLVDPASGY